MPGSAPVSEIRRQFVIGLAVMLPWPLATSLLQPLESALDHVIYLIGLFWSLFWDPIATIQNCIAPGWVDHFTNALIALLTLVWPTIAALPLLGRWPRGQVIGLWALQGGYAGSQALAGYFYVRTFVLSTP